MNEHLFRGFVHIEGEEETIFLNGITIHGKWVEGSLIKGINRIFIAPFPDNYNDCNMIDGTYLSIYVEEVIPETVGEFTGELDKNKKKIFEGDIVRVDFEQEYGGIKPQPSYKGVVKFEKGAFGIYKPSSFTQFFFQHGLIKTVIGSIYDKA